MVTKESPSRADGSVGQQRDGRQGEGGKAKTSSGGQRETTAPEWYRSVGSRNRVALLRPEGPRMYQEKGGDPLQTSPCSVFLSMNKNV